MTSVCQPALPGGTLYRSTTPRSMLSPNEESYVSYLTFAVLLADALYFARRVPSDSTPSAPLLEETPRSCELADDDTWPR